MKKKDIIINGLGIALVFVVTATITVPMPGAGYINIGDTVLMLFAMITSPINAFIIGGVGSALADLFLGYNSYIFFTLIVKGIEAMIVCYLFKKLSKFNYISVVFATIWMVIGYFITAWILYSSFEVALTTIPGNMIQAVSSVVLVLVSYKTFIKIHDNAFKNK